MVIDGKKAPSFKLPDDKGETVRLSQFKGKAVVLYFYPKDDTSGCTKEALEFTELKAKFSRAGAIILGVSPDSIAKHQKFKEKHGLTVRLLADEDKAVCTAYGVWVEKSMYGRKYMGVERSTFLIDQQGKIARQWRKVKVPGHAEEVLDAVKELKKTAA